MSILLGSALAAGGEALPIDAVLLVLSAGSLGAAVFARMVPPRGLPGPDRVPPDRSPWPLLAVFFGGLGFYLFGISAIASLWAKLGPRLGAATTQPFESLTRLRHRYTFASDS